METRSDLCSPFIHDFTPQILADVLLAAMQRRSSGRGGVNMKKQGEALEMHMRVRGSRTRRYVPRQNAGG